MGGFDFNGINGNRPVNGDYTTSPSISGNNASQPKTVEFGVKADAIGDIPTFSTTKPAFNSYDMDQMWAMAGITKPEGVKTLENTMAFVSEGVEYGVEYSEEDMNLARFMFENLQV